MDRVESVLIPNIESLVERSRLLMRKTTSNDFYHSVLGGGTGADARADGLSLTFLQAFLIIIYEQSTILTVYLQFTTRACSHFVLPI